MIAPTPTPTPTAHAAYDFRSLSVVVPVYRSAATLDALVSRLAAMLARVGLPYEIVLVDDSSPDDSWAGITRLSEGVPGVRGIALARNAGQHNALLAGIRAASGEVIVTLDDDLQHPPEEVPLLLARLAQGYDVVYGTPARETHGLLRDLASQITKLALQSAMGASIARDVSSFRAFRTPVREAFASYHSPYVSIDVLLTWGTARFAALPTRHEPRQVGKSNYTFRKLLTHALNMTTGFSTAPLQFASLLGLGLAAFGVLILLYVLVRFAMTGGSIPGFPFLASIVAVFSGAQLLALGIIGEYLARMHMRTMDKPTFVVREAHGAAGLVPPGAAGSGQRAAGGAGTDADPPAAGMPPSALPTTAVRA